MSDTVRMRQMPSKMLECAREMYRAFMKNSEARRTELGLPIYATLSWSDLPDEVRDNWCAATVAAFKFVAGESPDSSDFMKSRPSSWE